MLAVWSLLPLPFLKPGWTSGISQFMYCWSLAWRIGEGCAWKIPWAEEPGRVQSMGSLRVGHNWVTSLSLFTFMHWRRKWQPIPVFLPGESQGQGSLVGCHLWGRTWLKWLSSSSLENFEHYFTSMWDVCNCAVVWAFFGIAFLWDWNENWPFPVLWPLLSFPIWCHTECSTFSASSFSLCSTGVTIVWEKILHVQGQEWRPWGDTGKYIALRYFTHLYLKKKEKGMFACSWERQREGGKKWVGER